MEGLARFAVRQSLLVNLVGVTMVVVGAFTLQEMHRESLPQVPTGWCRVEVFAILVAADRQIHGARAPGPSLRILAQGD